ncbi:MAG: hypothetical protein ACRERS_04145 [Methylococcales bacterium]
MKMLFAGFAYTLELCLEFANFFAVFRLIGFYDFYLLPHFFCALRAILRSMMPAITLGAIRFPITFITSSSFRLSSP